MIDIPVELITEWKQLLSDELLDDCCATLKVAMKFGNKLILMSLGDGMLVVTSNGFKVGSPSDGMLFANQTRCLSSL